jgi:hypothetical protein
VYSGKAAPLLTRGQSPGFRLRGETGFDAAVETDGVQILDKQRADLVGAEEAGARGACSAARATCDAADRALVVGHELQTERSQVSNAGADGEIPYGITEAPRRLGAGHEHCLSAGPGPERRMRCVAAGS